MKREDKKPAQDLSEERARAAEGKQPQEAAGEPPEETLLPEEAATEELEELRRKAQERDEVFERLQRTTADFINYQKRMRKECENLRQFAVQNLAVALLPCLDNFDHAIAAAENSPDQSLLEGVKLVEQEFIRVLSNVGVERMQVEGRKFDPNFHEAVVEEETDQAPHQTVLEELRAGYMLNGRVIRAAQVRVSRHPNAGQAAQE
jgi:molecular chaperone GrpE